MSDIEEVPAYVRDEWVEEALKRAAEPFRDLPILRGHIEEAINNLRGPHWALLDAVAEYVYAETRKHFTTKEEQ